MVVQVMRRCVDGHYFSGVSCPIDGSGDHGRAEMQALRAAVTDLAVLGQVLQDALTAVGSVAFVISESPGLDLPVLLA